MRDSSWLTFGKRFSLLRLLVLLLSKLRREKMFWSRFINFFVCCTLDSRLTRIYSFDITHHESDDDKKLSKSKFFHWPRHCIVEVEHRKFEVMPKVDKGWEERFFFAPLCLSEHSSINYQHWLCVRISCEWRNKANKKLKSMALKNQWPTMKNHCLAWK